MNSPYDERRDAGLCCGLRVPDHAAATRAWTRERANAFHACAGKAQTTRRSKRWSGARQRAKLAEQAHPPMTETRSAALPACSDGFDDVDGGPECGVYIQVRGVEQVRVGSRLERCCRAFGVARVPPADVGEHVGIGDAFPGTLQLGGAPAGTHLRACGDEDLRPGVGEDDG